MIGSQRTGPSLSEKMKTVGLSNAETCYGRVDVPLDAVSITAFTIAMIRVERDDAQRPGLAVASAITSLRGRDDQLPLKFPERRSDAIGPRPFAGPAGELRGKQKLDQKFRIR
jgi:hypothetical protein